MDVTLKDIASALKTTPFATASGRATEPLISVGYAFGLPTFNGHVG